MGRRLRKGVRSDIGERHLRWENFEPRIFRGPPSIEPVAGTPRVHLFIEPAGQRIGARFFGKRGIPVPSPLAQVTIREVLIGADNALEISTGNRDLYKDFYSLCCSIADRVQVHREPISIAVRKALDSLAALIRRKELLDMDVQVGLLGELLFLQRVAARYGWRTAADTWYGPDSEEHDFVLPRVDAEVKTTTREQRVHRISSLTQLLPKVRRPLVFVSVQITPGGEGRQSFSLADEVAGVIAAAARAAPEAADNIRNHLVGRGWLDEDAPHYGRRYYLRTPILAVPVNAAFPAIVPATLAHIGEPATRIRKVAYSIEVDGMGFLDGTAIFARLLFGKGAK